MNEPFWIENQYAKVELTTVKVNFFAPWHKDVLKNALRKEGIFSELQKRFQEEGFLCWRDMLQCCN